jgi:HSP20 family protein
MMERNNQGGLSGVDQFPVEMIGLLRDPTVGQRWVSPRQHKIWRPPTDVYETDEWIVVKVEIAGMEKDDFNVELDAKRLVINGIRRDPAAKLAYQQMEILYGQFETEVHLPRAVDEQGIEATYQDGFLAVRLPKTRPRQVPIVSVE